MGPAKIPHWSMQHDPCSRLLATLSANASRRDYRGISPHPRPLAVKASQHLHVSSHQPKWTTTQRKSARYATIITALKTDSPSHVVKRLQEALWHAVGKIVDEESMKRNRNATPQFIGALADMVSAQIGTVPGETVTGNPGSDHGQKPPPSTWRVSVATPAARR